MPRAEAATGRALLHSPPLLDWRRPGWPVMLLVFAGLFAGAPPPMTGTFLRPIEAISG